jgi:hypothetical protein
MLCRAHRHIAPHNYHVKCVSVDEVRSVRNSPLNQPLSLNTVTPYSSPVVRGAGRLARNITKHSKSLDARVSLSEESGTKVELCVPTFIDRS